MWNCERSLFVTKCILIPIHKDKFILELTKYIGPQLSFIKDKFLCVYWWLWKNTFIRYFQCVVFTWNEMKWNCYGIFKFYLLFDKKYWYNYKKYISVMYCYRKIFFSQKLKVNTTFLMQRNLNIFCVWGDNNSCLDMTIRWSTSKCYRINNNIVRYMFAKYAI